MRKKTKSKQASKIDFLENQSINNTMAIKEGPTKRKKWTIHDMKDIKPLTQPQNDMMSGYMQGNNIIAHGSAGTGKTLIALTLAFNDVFSKDTRTDHIIIVRSCVPSRDVGFLPGTEEEKYAPFERPYIELCAELFKKSNTYENMKEAGLIEFTPTTFTRGVTWNNAVVIIDELQNFNWEEANTIMTRLGHNSRVIVVGDYKQNDLYRNKYDTSGIEKFLRICKKINEFDFIEFTKDDIVRGDFVKKWICAVEDDNL